MQVDYIKNCDCIDGIRETPDKSIDCIIADPPYGIDYQSARRTDKEKRLPKIKNDKAPYVWFLHDASRVLKDTGCIYVFCRWDTQDAFKQAMDWAGIHARSCIVWDRQVHGMGDLKKQFAPTHDNILFAAKHGFCFPAKRPKDVIQQMRIPGQKLLHPNEKPVELIKELIKSSTNEENVILDPFMGSGSTAVACKQTGRHYIGFELDAGYCSIAQDRARDALGLLQNQEQIGLVGEVK